MGDIPGDTRPGHAVLCGTQLDSPDAPSAFVVECHGLILRRMPSYVTVRQRKYGIALSAAEVQVVRVRERCGCPVPVL